MPPALWRPTPWRSRRRLPGSPGCANGWNTACAPSSGNAARGALRWRCNSSLSRLRITAQSPRLSVTPQISRACPALNPVICCAAAARKLSAASRTSPGSTTRNWPPPLEPSRMRASPNSANSARGSTSHTRVIHCDRPASKSSPAERADRPSAGPASRNSSVPRILP